MEHSANRLNGPVLVLNAGSSSLKLGLYEREGQSVHALWDETVDAPASAESLAEGTKRLGGVPPAAIGHRIVHGGPQLVEHQLLDDRVKQALRDSAHFAPLHVPVALRLVDAAEQMFPGVPQIACFDTAFHRTLPPVAARLPVPAEWDVRGVRRFGFHGLSYESIVRRLSPLPARVVIAHLGSGASVCAVREGKSVDTTMGMTPTGGIVMGTRTGDLDPGVLVYLMREAKLDANAIERLLNKESGLAGLANGEHDMRTLLHATDEDSKLAVEIFCMSVKKAIASYAAVLGGIDLLVFTGGIGEHSEDVRKRVCEGYLADLRVLVLPSEEDAQIARHCFSLTASRPEAPSR